MKSSNRYIIFLIAIPLVIIFRKSILKFYAYIYVSGFIIFLSYIYLKSRIFRINFFKVLKEYITLMPIAYTKDEFKKINIEWATYILVLVNFFVFLSIEVFFHESRREIINNFCFLPRTTDMFRLWLTPITSMFLHNGLSHLGWNMLYLWIFGTVVERRIGWKRFLFLYFITGIAGDLLSVVVYTKFIERPYHAIGASGAISGIMGVYLIRLYFKNMIFPIPILGFASLAFPVSLKVKINSLIVMLTFLKQGTGF